MRKDINNLGIANKKGLWMWKSISACPGDIIGWIRIPAMIMILVGALGLAKYTTSIGFKALKTTRFPSVEWCWILILLSVGIYLFCSIRSIYIKNKPIEKNFYEHTVVPQRWRSI